MDGDGLDSYPAIENNDIWNMLINDSTLSPNSQRSCNTSVKNVVILGDDSDGKANLVAKLKGIQENYFGPALDFHSMEVKDQDGDNSSNCSLWVMDGDLAHRGLLDLSLSSDIFHQSLVLISVDLSKPWNISKSLNKWIHVLATYINEHSGFDHSYLDNCKKKLIKDFQSYTEPGFENTDTNLHTMDIDSLTLSSNLGINIVVVCGKSDAIELLEKQEELHEEQIDFIQFYLRKVCLKLGAALVYISSKTDKNVKLLKEYILHKLYNFELNALPLLSNSDLFIPSGWDSEKRINILRDSFSDKIEADENYEKNLPPSNKDTYNLQELKEILVDDEQTFLNKFQAELCKVPTSNKSALPTSVHKSISHAPKTVGKVDVNNDKMLTMFFNSLLSNKKSNASSETPQSNS